VSRHDKKKKIDPYLVPTNEDAGAFPTTGVGTFGAAAANIYDATLDNWTAHIVRQALVPRFEPDENYFPGTDPALQRDMWAMPHLADSLSAEETAARLAELKSIRQRKEDLEFRGASWSYLAAELFDPLNYIPIMGLGGIGLKAGAKAGAIGVGAISAAQEGLRLSSDPLYTPQQAAIGIAAGTLFGTVFGGALGRFGKSVDHLAGASRIEADARLRDAEDVLNTSPSTYDIGHRAAEVDPATPATGRSTLNRETAAGPLNDAPTTDNLVYLVKGEDGAAPRVTLDLEEAILANGGKRPEALRLDTPVERGAVGDGPVLYRVPGKNGAPDRFTTDRAVAKKANGGRFPKGYKLGVGLSDEATVTVTKKKGAKKGAKKEDAGGTGGDGGGGFASRLSDEELASVLGVRKGGELHEKLIQKAEQRAAFLDQGAKKADLEAAKLEKKHRPSDSEEVRAMRESEIKGYRDTAQRLRDDATKLREVAIKDRLALDEARRLGGDIQVSVLKTGAGLSALHWSELPYFLLKNNRLGKVSEEIAHRVRSIADEIASTPGVRMKGGEEGLAPLPSVEASTWQWHAIFQSGAETTQAAYLKYLGIDVPANSTRQMLLIRAKQEFVDRTVNAIKNVLPGGKAMPTTTGKLTYREFREGVGRALIDGDQVAKHLPEDVQPFAREAVAAWRQILVDTGQELDRLNLLKTRASAKRQIRFNKERIGTLDARLQELRAESDLYHAARGGDQKALYAVREQLFSRRLNPENPVSPSDDAVRSAIRVRAEKNAKLRREVAGDRAELAIYNAQLSKYLDQSSGREAFHFPRVWRPDVIAARMDEVRSKLRDHYTRKPFVNRLVYNQKQRQYVYAKIEMKPTEEKLNERVEQTISHLMRETNWKHGEQIDMAEMLDGLYAQRAVLESELARLEKRVANGMEGYEPPVTVERGQKVVDEEGNPIMGHAELMPDGTWRIRVNDEAVRAKYAEKEPEFWSEKFGIKSADDLVDFVEKHERAHTRLFRRGVLESTAEYETRINREALKMFERGEDTPTPRRLSEMRDDLDGVLAKIAEFEAQGPGTVRRGMGQRGLDVDSREWMDFIETDVEEVMSGYIQKIAPMIEMARRFGDPAMTPTLGKLKADLDDAIVRAELAEGKPLPKMRAERDAALQAVRDLRDKVLGNYGLPENPDAFHIRAVQTARNFNVLSLMGKAWMAALVDTGNIILGEGLGRTFRGLGHLWANFGRTDTGLAMARREAELAGLASELTFATRLNSMMDLQGKHWGRTRLEQMAQSGAAKMFIANGLAFWTDAAKRFAGALVSSRIIETVVAVAEGRATKAQLSKISRAGISKEAAKVIAAEWRQAGGKVVDGYHIANTEAWRSPLATRLFRAALAQEVNVAVITPGAADKLNFMSKPLGALIFQYRSFSMAATWRITAVALQQRDKQALAGVMSLVALAMMVDKWKRPDWAEPSFPEALYRGVELSGVGGIFTDLNSALEDASGHDLGLRATLGIGDSFKPTNWASRLGGVLGPATGQWASLAYALFDPSANPNEQARAMRYMIPFNNLWLWDDMFKRMQREGANLLEAQQ